MPYFQQLIPSPSSWPFCHKPQKVYFQADAVLENLSWNLLATVFEREMEVALGSWFEFEILQGMGFTRYVQF